MSRFFARLLVASLVLSLLLVPLTASAHTEVESGSYILEIGWINEPVLVNAPNGLYLFVTPKAESGESGEHQEGEEGAGGEDHHAEGVIGAEGTLTFTVDYGGVRRAYDLRPIPDQPGLYTADILPTREGQYTFIFGGALNGETVDLSFEPEEVEAPGKLAFPEALPSTADLLAQLSAVQAQARTAQTVGIVGVVLGLIGTGIGVVSLTRKK